MRAVAFARAGADAVLVDGVRSLRTIAALRELIDCPLMYNQIAGGKSPPCTLTELHHAGIALVNYSTPCLFAAHAALEESLRTLKSNDGRLDGSTAGAVELSACSALLKANLALRNGGA